MRLRWILLAVLLGGSLLGVLGPRLHVGGGPGQLEVAEARCKEYFDAACLFRIVREAWPRTLEDLCDPLKPDREPLYPRVEEDPWGTQFELRLVDEGDAHVRSAGPDGWFDTEDDVRWPQR